MITPRATRLIRAAGAQAFREAAIALACDGAPLDARDRLVVVPTHAAAAHLLRSIEDGRADLAACVLPDFATPAEIAFRFAERLPPGRPVLTAAEREVLLTLACRSTCAAGIEPPFQVRPALVAEILAWYDELQRHQHDVDSFERLALAALEPGAMEDRGAERLVRQTRFLVAAFREYERLVSAAGADEHALRRAAIQTEAERPIRHVVLTVADRSVDAHGLQPADWDLLTRVPRLERLDVLVTDGRLAGPLHERLHRMLPGIEEVRFESRTGVAQTPCLHVPSAEAAVYATRDREEEVAAFARRVKYLVRSGDASSLDRIALVVNQPMPYVGVARAVLHAGGVPCQLSQPLPLAGEPYAAAIDLVLSCVATGFSRAAVIALLQSPHFHFALPDGARLEPRTVAALGDMLTTGEYQTEPGSVDRLVDALERPGSSISSPSHVVAPLAVVRRIVGELRPLTTAAPAAAHLAALLAFMTSHEVVPSEADPWHERHMRARGAILGTVAALRDAYDRFDPVPLAFDEIAALIRRWIDSQTFAPGGDGDGVHVVDAATAPFGDFEHLQLAGLVDGEWPNRQRRSIFYSAAILRELGWPADSLRLEGGRAAFTDLLTLASRSVAASTFLLEDDALVSPSALAEDVGQAELERVVRPVPDLRIFEDEALALEDVPEQYAVEPARRWANLRAQLHPPTQEGEVSAMAMPPRTWSVSALERYQDCPFRFFAGDVLRLPEPVGHDDAFSPRARGRFVHEVLQRFFEAWDARTNRAPIDVARFDDARALCASVAEPLLARLSDADAALERARLFGSAISVGIVDVMLAIEAALAGEVRERWLEYRFEGAFAPGEPGRRVGLRGVVDRVDLLNGNRLRVIDYKTGPAPNPRRALQAAVYAICLQEQLTARDHAPWTIAEAGYVAFGGRRAFARVVQGGGAAADQALDAAWARVLAVLDGIARADFPPRPHDPLLCRGCGYAPVCRNAAQVNGDGPYA